jgi:butyryl-CoA dehydrogenase
MRLTEEQRLLRDTARDVAWNLLAPHSAEWDREGGAGADHVGYALALEEIGAGTSEIRRMLIGRELLNESA